MFLVFPLLGFEMLLSGSDVSDITLTSSNVSSYVCPAVSFCVPRLDLVIVSEWVWYSRLSPKDTANLFTSCFQGFLDTTRVFPEFFFSSYGFSPQEDTKCISYSLSTTVSTRRLYLHKKIPNVFRTF